MTDDTMVRHTGNAAGTPPAPDGGNSAGAPPAPDAQRRAARGAFARVGFACLLLLVSAFLVQSLLLALFPEAMRVLLANSWGYYAFAMLSQYAVGLPLFWLLLRPLPRQTWPDGRLSVHSWWEFLLMCFGLGFGGNLIGRFVTLLASLLLGVNAVNPLETLLTGTALAPQFVYVGLLAPVIEELLFRKLLIDRLHRFGDRAAILVSAVAFGLLHGNFSQLFYACFIGMLLGYVYCRTRRLRYTILLHMAINLLGGVLPSALLSAQLAAGVYSAGLLAAYLVGLVLFFNRLKQAVFAPGALPPGRGSGRAMFGNTGMVLYAIASLALCIFTLLSAPA